MGRGVDYGLSPGGLSASQFETGTTPTAGQPEFFYDATVSTLFWDQDGSDGGSVAIATFTTPVTLTNSDFLILLREMLMPHVHS